MTEGVTIYLLLWLLYLSECFIWIGKRGVAFVAPWNHGWRVRMPSAFIASRKGGAIFLNPLLPATRVAVAALSPISISPDGVCAFNAQSFDDGGRPPQTPHYFAFENIQTCAAEDRLVLINSAPFVECGTAAEARWIADWIIQAARVPAAQRRQIVGKFIAARFDQGATVAGFAEFSKQLRLLEIVCSLFFPLLFVVTPALAFYYGVEDVIIPAAIMMLVFAGVIAWFVWRKHQALGASLGNDRWSSVAKIIFCPPGAIRAAGELTARFPLHCDPLVVSALLPRDERQRFAAAYVRDLRFPIKDGLEGAAKKVVDDFRAELLLQATAYAKTQPGLRIEAVEMPPARESGCRSYCPRCHSQFTTEGGECSGCDGVSLRRLDGAVARPAATATAAL